MRRLLAALAFVLLGVPAAAVGSQEPVLAGPWSMDQQGYGHIRPKTIFNGGDGSGLLSNIHWMTWGHSRAIGMGIGLYVAPNESNAEGTREPARVVLFQLGYCKGRRAYEAIEWYFPQHGQRFNSREYIEACTGEYHS